MVAGGCSGFREPVVVTEEVLPQIERINQWLCMKFGGKLEGADACWNIDRIMREPFSWNNPDDAKVRAGRKRVRSYILEQEKRHRYAWSAFQEALKWAPQRKQKAEGERGSVVVNVQVGDVVRRIDDINELDKWEVPDRIKVICVQGKHPEQPKEGDNSRSMWVFDAVCELVRCGVPHEVIFSILTDPEYLISESVLEKGGNAESYAIRQIERAEEKAIDPALAEMNDRYFVCRDIGGKPGVCEWKTVEGIERLNIRQLKPFEEAFRNQYVEVKVGGKTEKKQKGKWWLDHPRRRTYENLVLEPTKPETFDDNYNLWRGFGVKPQQGDWSLMQAHIRDVLANGNRTLGDYIIKWSAWKLQNPGERPEVALVFIGGEGVGKGIFGRAMKDLLGRNGKQIFSSKHLVGRFNAHLRDCCLLIADEAVAPDDKDGKAALKGLVTEPEIALEGKGRDVDWVLNHLGLIIISNDERVVPAGKDARRFVVADVPNTHQQDAKYFTALVAELKNGGLEAMLHDLLIMDLKGWHPRARVITDALREQQRLNLTPAERLVYEVLDTGQFFPTSDTKYDTLRQQGYVSTYDLSSSSTEYFGEKVGYKAIANVFDKLLFYHDLHHVDRQWIPRPLKEARENFRKFILDVKFNEAITSWAKLGKREIPTGKVIERELPFVPEDRRGERA
ncbi:primase-helicase family protein [Bradyrhizobium sp. STM 3561]|uniref:primase-helicase family protein n=1 Tax=Bradyrhizobium sp. STM 3561 TaxID=578923 RepID=UPI00388FBCD7